MRRLLSILAFLFITTTSSADHFTGAELRYEYVGSPSIYRITLTLYKTCETGAIDFPSFMSVVAQSQSPFININKNLGRVSNDTLQPYCPSIVTSCTNISSPYPGYLKAVYSDTLQLPSAGSNWLLIQSNSSRNFGITNLLGASGQSFYIDAPLTTSSLNSSPVLSDVPPHVIFVNDSISVPLSAYDKDGDSIVYTISTPKSSTTSFIPYSNGYSQSQPFGTGGLCYISADNQIIFKSQQTGKFTISLVISEYRNGSFIGYIMRDFIVICQNANPGNSFSVPTPTNKSLLQTYTCPGKKNALNLEFKDPNPADSVYLEIETPTLPGWSFNVTQTPGIGAGRGNISWTTPPSVNPATLPFIEFHVKVRDNSCALIGKGGYVYKVRLRECNADSVWPGDANSDKIVDRYDPLAIGLAYGDTGAKRPNATTNWIGQECDYWEGTFLNNIDVKHADCNGDGIVDTADLHAITANYGQKHAKGGPMKKTTATHDLFFDHSGIKANPDSTVTLSILLGLGIPFTDVYGLATNINIDGISLFSAPEISYKISWLGDSSSTIRYVKNITPNSVDWAYVRNNKLNTSGSGLLAAISFQIPPATPNGTLVTLTYSDTKIINSDGTELTDFRELQDTFYVWHLPSSIQQVNNTVSGISVHPNPAQNDIFLSWQAFYNEQLSMTITDITGKPVHAQIVQSVSGNNKVLLPVQHLAQGLYFLTIRTDEGNHVQTVKWMKQ